MNIFLSAYFSSYQLIGEKKYTRKKINNYDRLGCKNRPSHRYFNCLEEKVINQRTRVFGLVFCKRWNLYESHIKGWDSDKQKRNFMWGHEISLKSEICTFLQESYEMCKEKDLHLERVGRLYTFCFNFHFVCFIYIKDFKYKKVPKVI